MKKLFYITMFCLLGCLSANSQTYTIHKNLFGDYEVTKRASYTSLGETSVRAYRIPPPSPEEWDLSKKLQELRSNGETTASGTITFVNTNKVIIRKQLPTSVCFYHVLNVTNTASMKIGDTKNFVVKETTNAVYGEVKFGISTFKAETRFADFRYEYKNMLQLSQMK